MTQEARRTPLEPAPEAYEGTNIPYRGTEQHGVQAKEIGLDPAEHIAGEKPMYEYEETPKDVDPIPVRVVTEHGRERKEWRTGRVTILSGQSTNLVGLDMSRTMVLLKVVSGSVVIGHTPAPAAFLGYPLSAGDTFTTDAETAIYATATDDADVAVLQSYSVEM